jgi:hypothetical protein
MKAVHKKLNTARFEYRYVVGLVVGIVGIYTHITENKEKLKNYVQRDRLLIVTLFSTIRHFLKFLLFLTHM